MNVNEFPGTFQASEKHIFQWLRPSDGELTEIQFSIDAINYIATQVHFTRANGQFDPEKSDDEACPFLFKPFNIVGDIKWIKPYRITLSAAD